MKAAQALGIPAAACIASWDHLTTKGLIRVRPDLVSVWNREQQAEAVEFHGIDPARIVVTGAQPFDRWFERTATDRAQFCPQDRAVARSADRPLRRLDGVDLGAGSGAPLRASMDRGAACGAVARGRRHPDPAASVQLDALAATPTSATCPTWSIYPRGANPVNEADRQDYFDSLYHSDAVVGVNTTAMIEAAIVGRTVHSVLAPEFQDTQGGTLHFRYLLAENGGFLRVAPLAVRNTRSRSPRRFGRLRSAAPRARASSNDSCGRTAGTSPATPLLVDALEQLALEPARRAPGAASPCTPAGPLRLAGESCASPAASCEHAPPNTRTAPTRPSPHMPRTVRADMPNVKGG